MKQFVPLIALLFSAKASAQLVYEPLAYPAGAALDNQVNPNNGQPWLKMSSSPSDDDITLSGSSLSISGLAPSTDGSVVYGGAGKSERLSLGESISAGTVYYSMIFQVTAGVGATPAFIAGFSNQSGASLVQPQTVGTRLYLRQGSTGSTFNVGVSKNSSTATDIAFDTTDFSLNTPVLVVGSYQINGSAAGTDDQSMLYINPTNFGAANAPTISTPSSPILAAPVTGSDLLDNGVPSLAGFVLRQASATVPNVQVDELRVDTNWAQITPPVGTSWALNQDGAWSQGNLWSTSVSPNDANAFVNFPSVGSQSRTINVDQAYALRTINFTSSASYTLDGSGSLSFSSSAAINVTAGSHEISASVLQSADLSTNVAAAGSLRMTNLTSNGYALRKAGAGTLELTHVRGSALNIIGGTVRILPDGTDAGVSKVAALNINNVTANGATSYQAALDLSNNSVAVDYAGASPIGSWNGSAYTGLTGAIASGRNGGAWNGAGIITSQSDAQSQLTTIGIDEASDALHLSENATAIWRGQTVDASTVLIAYTYGGDANLDGRLDGDDYFAIDSHVNQNGSVFGYANGDFNYDGRINGDDYFIIDSNIDRQGLPLDGASGMALISTVPEPASVGLFALAGLLVRRRRIQRQQFSA